MTRFRWQGLQSMPTSDCVKDALVQRLVFETNRYAEQCLAAAQRPLSKYSSLTQWMPVEGGGVLVSVQNITHAHIKHQR